jgi:DNA-binding protein HU-beta
MADLNRQDIIRGMMAEVDGLSYSMAAASLEAFLTCVSRALVDRQSVVLKNFGKFSVRDRKARRGTHPHSHKPIEIPAVSIPHFAPSPVLKNLVNQVNQAHQPSSKSSGNYSFLPDRSGSIHDDISLI